MTTPDHSVLLESVADALNACLDAGITVRLKHDSALTGAGYILLTHDGRYVARTLAYLPFDSD